MQALCYCLDVINVTAEWEALADICHVSYNLVLPIILSLAAVTNLVNVTVLLRGCPKSRANPTPTRLHLLSLGLSHCCICCVVIVGLTIRRREGLNYACAFYLAHLEEPLYNVFNCSCSFIILGLSSDRYQAVCRPHKYSAAQALRKTPRRLLMAYALPAFMYIPSCFSQSPQYSRRLQGWSIAEGAIFNAPAWRAWAVFLEVLHRIVPCALLVALNLHILSSVLRLKSSRASRLAKAKAGGSRHEQRIIYLLLALTLTFLVTNLPATSLKLVYALINQHCLTNMSLEVVRAVANCLEMAGICGDFFLYFVMNPEYRRDLHSLVLCVCGCCAPPTARCPLQETGDHRSTPS